MEAFKLDASFTPSTTVSEILWDESSSERVTSPGL